MQIESVGESHLSFPEQNFLLLPNRTQQVELTPDFIEQDDSTCTSLEKVIFEMQSDIPIQIKPPRSN